MVLSGAAVTVPTNAAAIAVARRHWNSVAGSASTDEEVAAAADRLCLELHNGLSRWIGVEGYRTLQDRALQEIIAEHPALGKLSFGGNDETANLLAVRESGRKEVADGMVALVALVVELLGRIIGIEMALRLVEHWGDRARAES